MFRQKALSRGYPHRLSFFPGCDTCATLVIRCCQQKVDPDCHKQGFPNLLAARRVPPLHTRLPFVQLRQPWQSQGWATSDAQVPELGSLRPRMESRLARVIDAEEVNRRWRYCLPSTPRLPRTYPLGPPDVSRPPRALPWHKRVVHRFAGMHHHLSQTRFPFVRHRLNVPVTPFLICEPCETWCSPNSSDSEGRQRSPSFVTRRDTGLEGHV